MFGGDKVDRVEYMCSIEIQLRRISKQGWLCHFDIGTLSDYGSQSALTCSKEGKL